jgi:hypothetical protein
MSNDSAIASVAHKANDEITAHYGSDVTVRNVIVISEIVDALGGDSIHVASANKLKAWEAYGLCSAAAAGQLKTFVK